MTDVFVGIDCTQLPPRVCVVDESGESMPSDPPLEPFNDKSRPSCRCVDINDPQNGVRHLGENSISPLTEWFQNDNRWFVRNPDQNVRRIGIAHPALLPAFAIRKLQSEIAISVFRRRLKPDEFEQQLFPIAAPLAIVVRDLMEISSTDADVGWLVTCSPGMGHISSQDSSWWAREWMAAEYERCKSHTGYRITPNWFCSESESLSAVTQVDDELLSQKIRTLEPNTRFRASNGRLLEEFRSRRSARLEASHMRIDSEAVAYGAAVFARSISVQTSSSPTFQLNNPIPLPRGVLGARDKKTPSQWRELVWEKSLPPRYAMEVQASHVYIAAVHGFAIFNPVAPRWKVDFNRELNGQQWLLHGLLNPEQTGIRNAPHRVEQKNDAPSWSSAEWTIIPEVRPETPSAFSVS